VPASTTGAFLFSSFVRPAMRATKVLVASGIIVFSIFFLDAFVLHEDRLGVVDGRTGLQAFELLGALVSLHLLTGGRPGRASTFDVLSCLISIATGILGFAGLSITLFALHLFIRDRADLRTKAAGTVAAAVAIQATWAPLIFSHISFIFLKIDASFVGSFISVFVPGATWSGTIVATPSGHDVMITAPCASFHNLSLASLCWVTLTMLQRPHWVKSDIYVGLVAMLIQFGFNIWRLVFVCLSLPMYQFWHDGMGKHIFSGVATVCAICFVQFCVGRTRQEITAAA
jgi:hypothetical protein